MVKNLIRTLCAFVGPLQVPNGSNPSPINGEPSNIYITRSPCNGSVLRAEVLLVNETAQSLGSNDGLNHERNFSMATTSANLMVTADATEVKAGEIAQVQESPSKLWYLSSDATCRICNRAYYDKTSLRKHLRLHFDERPFHCDLCNSTFRQRQHLKYHLRAHNRAEGLRSPRKSENNSDPDWTCRLCHTRIGSLRSLRQHMLRAHRTRQAFRCQWCGKDFYHQALLQKHQDHDHGTDTCLVCHVCSQKFHVGTPWEVLKVHRQKLHGRQEKRKHMPYLELQCGYCRRKYKSQGSLNEHLKLHNSANHYQCSLCQRQFSLKGNCQKHIKRVCQRKSKNLIVAEAMNPEKIHELLAAEPADAERLSRSPGAETHHVSTGREQGQGVGARSPFGQRQRQILEDWLMEHASDPYPSSLIKIHLSELTKLTVQQLDRWFINARARKMRKAMDGHGAGSAKARS